MEQQGMPRPPRAKNQGHVVCHYYWAIPPEDRLKRLIALYSRMRFPCVIFCSTDSQVDYLHSELWARRYSVASVRSDVSEEEWVAKRDAFMERWSVPIFITTDAWADHFGDSAVKLVINYELPEEALYLKRAKAVGVGFLMTLVDEHERTRLASFEQVEEIKELPREVMEERCKSVITDALRLKQVRMYPHRFSCYIPIPKD